MITVDVRFMRGVATWQPITKLNKNVAALECVSLVVADNKLSAFVTDRFRVVYSVTEYSGDDETITMPMSLVVQFVSGVKQLKSDNNPVTIENLDGTVTISGGGVTVSGVAFTGHYPNVMSLVQGFEPAIETNNTVWFDMARMGDVVKFHDPSLSLTENKNNVVWRFRQRNNPNDKGFAPWLLDKGSPDSFGVLIQPNSK